jgi:putative transposase
MRAARIVAQGLSYYHGLSRIIDRQLILDDTEKERFRILLRKTEAFSGVRILTHSIMTNHVHLVLEVPEGQSITDDDTFARMRAFYPPDFVADYALQVRKAREAGRESEAEALLDAYRYRMHDLSEFMKTLLQRFTQSYNLRHERHGTLWEGRFTSILVEGRGDALAMLAAYVELNAVRAGIVDDPKDYRFCGYGEAVAGNRAAIAGQRKLERLLGDQTPNGQSYREFVFMQGATHRKGATSKEEFRKHAQEVIEQGGKLSVPELLHCRVRYFSAGLVLGSQIFIQDTFQTHRDNFGTRRRNGPRPIRGADLPTLFTMRDLRLAPITPPS